MLNLSELSKISFNLQQMSLKSIFIVVERERSNELTKEGEGKRDGEVKIDIISTFSYCCTHLNKQQLTSFDCRAMLNNKLLSQKDHFFKSK